MDEFNSNLRLTIGDLVVDKLQLQARLNASVKAVMELRAKFPKEEPKEETHTPPEATYKG